MISTIWTELYWAYVENNFSMFALNEMYNTLD